MRKIYLLASMIAILTLTFAATITTVKAYSTEFYVNVDPLGLGWTELQGVDPVSGEYIYKDIGSGNTGRVGTGDTRLTPVADGAGGWYEAGTTVLATDNDAIFTLTLSTAFGTVKHAENVAANTLYNHGEYIYKAAGTTVAAGDTRYSNVPGYKVGSVVVAGDTDIGTALTTFKTTTPNFEKYAHNLVTNTAYDYARLSVDINWITDIPDNTADGMRGWQLFCQVDPAVLTPLGYTGAAGGYVLMDFLGNVGSELTTAIVSSIGTDTIDVSEQILGALDPPAGAGDAWSYGKLITLTFIPQSKIGHSPIDLLDTSLGYQDAGTEAWHPVTLTDGNYNVPSGPEFPLGLTPVIMLAPMIPILYIWRMRKRRVR